MAEWGGLENRCGLPGHRGFKSHPLRQKHGSKGANTAATLRQKHGSKGVNRDTIFTLERLRASTALLTRITLRGGLSNYSL